MMAKRSNSPCIGTVSIMTVVAATLWASTGCDRAPPASAEQAVAPKVTTTGVVQQGTTDVDEYTGRTEASEAGEIPARLDTGCFVSHPPAMHE